MTCLCDSLCWSPPSFTGAETAATITLRGLRNDRRTKIGSEHDHKANNTHATLQMSLPCYYVESIPSHAADILTFNRLEGDQPRFQCVNRTLNYLLLEWNGPNYFSLH